MTQTFVLLSIPPEPECGVWVGAEKQSSQDTVEQGDRACAGMAVCDAGLLRLGWTQLSRPRGNKLPSGTTRNRKLTSQQLGISPGKVNTMSENSCALSKQEASAATLPLNTVGQRRWPKVGLSLKQRFKIIYIQFTQWKHDLAWCLYTVTGTAVKRPMSQLTLTIA